ncbi:MAG TPA: hypothetical protein VFL96_10635 [Acidobacteriaceae bacterium]|nr:hypothetical protein [Acidobacteriaceae bacterium]
MILFHEAEHFFAGILCGFRLVNFRVGIVELRSSDTHVHLHKQKTGKGQRWKHLFSGAVSMSATERSMKHLRLRYFSYIIAGPATNFVSALLALPIALERTTTGGLCKYFIVGSVLFGFINLIPFTSGELKSDGYKLWIMLFNRTKRDVLLYWFTLPVRVNEIRAFCRAGDIQHACEKADQFIRISNGLPSVIAKEDYRQRLIKFQAYFQELASQSLIAQVDVNALDPIKTLNLAASDYISCLN